MNAKEAELDDREFFEITAKMWRWQGNDPAAGSWHFLTVEGQTAAEIRYAALGRTRGFGSIRVTATVGATRWQTSLFPHRESGGFILPLKAEVRQRENLETGQQVTVTLEV